MRAFLLPALALLATGSCFAQDHGCRAHLNATTVNSMSSPMGKGMYSYALVVQNKTSGPVMFTVEAGQILGHADTRTVTVGASSSKSVVFGSGTKVLKMTDMQVAYDVRHSGSQPYVLLRDCK